MMGKMAIATALRGLNDLGHSATPTFLSRKRFYLQKLSKNEQKLSVAGKFKKFEISVHGTSNPVILRLQGACNYGR